MTGKFHALHWMDDWRQTGWDSGQNDGGGRQSATHPVK